MLWKELTWIDHVDQRTIFFSQLNRLHNIAVFKSNFMTEGQQVKVSSLCFDFYLL